jgi:hypothetical protein
MPHIINQNNKMVSFVNMVNKFYTFDTIPKDTVSVSSFVSGFDCGKNTTIFLKHIDLLIFIPIGYGFFIYLD